MNKITTFVICLTLGSAPLWAMPTQITFQGTLKQKNVPVNGTRNMQFNFVDSAGASIPNTQPINVANVQVTNGLFAVQLPIDTAIPWQQYTPFIQVSVEGQILAPNQPLNANLYAIAAIPTGMIAMFARSCPTGWTSFGPLNDANAFPRGGTTYGAAGGSETHAHSLGAPSVTGAGVVFTSGQGSGSTGENWGRNNHVHLVSAQSNLPPYVTLVFCKKE